jgi:competence protein ComEC
MWLWWCLPLAWLAGLWLQLQQAELSALMAYQRVLAVSVLSVPLGLAVRRMAWARRVPQLVFRCVYALAVAGVAWSTTGWRANSLLDEQVPAAWQGRDVQALVRLQGLPRKVPDGVLMDATVLAWPGASPDQVLPELISLSLPAHMEGVVPEAGQQWRLTMRLHAPYGQANPAGFDATLGYFERGVRAMGRLSAGHAPQLVKLNPTYFWQGLIDRWRQAIRERIFATVDDTRLAGVLAGLAIGDQSAIDQEDWALFRDTGVAHIVSISGGHITMLGWVVASLVRFFWPMWQRGVHWWPAPDLARWMAVLVCAFYALLAGWGLPAQRTVWMLLIIAFLRGRGVMWPWPMVLLLSAAMLTALDPWGLLQVGFWLSYVAVGVLMSTGFMGVVDPFEVRTGKAVEPGAPEAAAQPAWLLRACQSAGHVAWQGFVSLLQTQWRISMALAPLSLVCFQQVSLVGLVANLWAIPVFTIVVTPLAMLGALASPLWLASAAVVELAHQGLQAMSHWPMATMQAPALPWWVGVPAVLAAWALAVSGLPWRWRLVGGPFLLAMFWLPTRWWLIEPPPVGQFQLLAADIGQGTSVLIRTAHHALLFDTGPRIGTATDAGERTLIPLLRSLAVERLDALMISHEDTDHVGGAPSIMRHMPVSSMISSLADAHPLLKEVDAHGRSPLKQACMAGQTWMWDGVRFEVLHPTADDYARREAQPDKMQPNAMSCVLRVSEPGRSSATALITGDIGVVQEAAIIERARAQEASPQALHAAVLLAAHHGSDTSSSEAFLRAVAPEMVVIQSGARNAYGHPSAAVLARLQSLRLHWQATPACGAYVWRSHGHGDGGGGDATTGQGGSAPASARGQCWRASHPRYWDESGRNWLASPMASLTRKARKPKRKTDESPRQPRALGAAALAP